MPELGWQWGYPLALAVMFGVCSTLYRKFKRAGWLWLAKVGFMQPTRFASG